MTSSTTHHAIFCTKKTFSLYPNPHFFHTHKPLYLKYISTSLFHNVIQIPKKFIPWHFGLQKVFNLMKCPHVKWVYMWGLLPYGPTLVLVPNNALARRHYTLDLKLNPCFIRSFNDKDFFSQVNKDLCQALVC